MWKVLYIGHHSDHSHPVFFLWLVPERDAFTNRALAWPVGLRQTLVDHDDIGCFHRVRCIKEPPGQQRRLDRAKVIARDKVISPGWQLPGLIRPAFNEEAVVFVITRPREIG